MKLYVADFGVDGCAVAIAPDVYRALEMMRDEHPRADSIKVERVWESLTEHELTAEFVHANLGDI